MTIQQLSSLKKTDIVLTSSPIIAKQFLQSEVIYNSEPKTVLTNCYNIELCNSLRSNRFVIGYIGGIRHSLINDLLKSVEKIDDVKLLIVGGPPKGKSGYNGIYRHIIQESNKKGIDVSITGPRPYTEMANYYRGCDIIVVGHYVPKLLRSFAVPKKLLDSMAYGKPVLVGPYSARQRIVEKHDCGIVTSNFNKSICLLIDDSRKRHRLGSNGMSAFINYYCWERQSHKLVKIYNDLLDVV